MQNERLKIYNEQHINTLKTSSVLLIFLLPQALIWLGIALLLILSLLKMLIFCPSWIFAFFLIFKMLSVFFIVMTKTS